MKYTMIAYTISFQEIDQCGFTDDLDFGLEDLAVELISNIVGYLFYANVSVEMEHAF